MGQAVLSDPVTRYRDVGCLVCVLYMYSVYAGSPPERKGIGLIFSTLPTEIDGARLDCASGLCLGVVKRGNASELGDVGESSGKSFLFFVRMATTPGIGLSGDRGIASVKHHPSCGVRNALVGP